MAELSAETSSKRLGETTLIRLCSPIALINSEGFMQRRQLVAWLVLTAAHLPVRALAQSAIPLVGFLNNGSNKSFSGLAGAFVAGLADAGYIAGKNVNVEYRWADGHNERLPALLQDLIKQRAFVIVATGGTPTALAAKEASATIPVVFSIGADPIKFGLVASLNRPGGNMTGVSFLANTVLAKQVEILDEIVAKQDPIGFLVNPSNPNTLDDTEVVTKAAEHLGRGLVVASAAAFSEIESAFSLFDQAGIRGLLIFPDALFTSQRQFLLQLIDRRRLPALYNSREFAEAGGLIGYGARQSDAYLQAGRYVGRVLKGEKPSDLPVVQSTAIELIINLKTAKSLGVNVPLSLLGLANEVIE